MDESGFYKFEAGHLFHAPNSVTNKHYQLKRESKDEHEYPTWGWNWFDTKAEALIYFGLDEERYDGEWVPS